MSEQPPGGPPLPPDRMARRTTPSDPPAKPADTSDPADRFESDDEGITVDEALGEQPVVKPAATPISGTPPMPSGPKATVPEPGLPRAPLAGRPRSSSTPPPLPSANRAIPPVDGAGSAAPVADTRDAGDAADRDDAVAPPSPVASPSAEPMSQPNSEPASWPDPAPLPQPNPLPEPETLSQPDALPDPGQLPEPAPIAKPMGLAERGGSTGPGPAGRSTNPGTPPGLPPSPGLPPAPGSPPLAERSAPPGGAPAGPGMPSAEFANARRTGEGFEQSVDPSSPGSLPPPMPSSELQNSDVAVPGGLQNLPPPGSAPGAPAPGPVPGAPPQGGSAPGAPPIGAPPGAGPEFSPAPQPPGPGPVGSPAVDSPPPPGSVPSATSAVGDGNTSDESPFQLGAAPGSVNSKSLMLPLLSLAAGALIVVFSNLALAQSRFGEFEGWRTFNRYLIGSVLWLGLLAGLAGGLVLMNRSVSKRASTGTAVFGGLVAFVGLISFVSGLRFGNGIVDFFESLVFWFTNETGAAMVLGGVTVAAGLQAAKSGDRSPVLAVAGLLGAAALNAVSGLVAVLLGFLSFGEFVDKVVAVLSAFGQGSALLVLAAAVLLVLHEQPTGLARFVGLGAAIIAGASLLATLVSALGGNNQGGFSPNLFVAPSAVAIAAFAGFLALMVERRT